MCVPAGGVVGTECGRGARDTVLSTPYASPLPPAGTYIPSWPGLGALYVYVLCASREMKRKRGDYDADKADNDRFSRHKRDDDSD